MSVLKESFEAATVIHDSRDKYEPGVQYAVMFTTYADRAPVKIVKIQFETWQPKKDKQGDIINKGEGIKVKTVLP